MVIMTSSAPRGTPARTRGYDTPSPVRPSAPLAALLGAGALLLAACGGGAGEDARENPQIVDSTYQVQFIAEVIAGEDADVSNVVTVGNDPHDDEVGRLEVVTMAD